VLGTVALFSDIEHAGADFTSGTLEISAEGRSWSGAFDNLKPGETLVFAVELRSEGTLPLDYEVQTQLSGDLAGGDHPCYVSETRIDGVPAVADTLSEQGGADESDLVEVDVTMPLEAGSEYEGKSGHLEITFNAVQQ